MLYLKLLLFGFRSLLLPSPALRLENLALRQQLAVLKHQAKRPRLRNRDRFFWVLLSRIWSLPKGELRRTSLYQVALLSSLRPGSVSSRRTSVATPPRKKSSAVSLSDSREPWAANSIALGGRATRLH